MKFLIKISHWIDLTNDWVGRTSSWMVLLMILIGAYNATTRKLSQAIGVDLSSNTYIETQWYLFSLIFLLTGAYALRHNVHVRVDVIFSRLSRRRKAVIDLIGTIIFLIPFCVLLLWVTWPYALASFEIFEMSPDPGGLPRWPIKASIFVAFLLLLLQAFSQIVHIVALLTGAVPDDDELLEDTEASI